ncbi:Subunit of the glycosylphosphatidylinositol transamidase complex-like protein [Microsporum canis]|uniref:GPI transamidase component GPI16 n=1 Tax=Arthroderma otae (strain ATCC MYA-4605 / CBS 113480) TaxID=554155 RepID=C5FQQ5_ARTOC|nr:GPI transamidase component GPI16 [Microsporum canis CBS 113480]EEQ32208.1 GPI transamidase component GPI16 [Microsporum canis CBS 113480]
MMRILLSLLCTPVASAILTTANAVDYHEQLVLHPLPPSNLLASFNFRSNESSAAFEQQNYRYFPRSLGQILQHAHTKELHLRFTTGRWDAENWGERPWHGFKEGGTGVELWAWIEALDADAAFAKWISLTQSLSGLFCASMNFIDSTRTTTPSLTFNPTGNHSTPTDSLHLLHGTLPGEVVCTENLTPFLKLLPCKGKSGISGLFDGHKLFDASWQSMSVDVRPTCVNKSEDCQVEIEQTVDMVLDLDRSKRARDNPIPRPVPAGDLICDESKPYHSGDFCYPIGASRSQTWSIEDVFGRMIPSSCPLGRNNAQVVCIRVPNSIEVLPSSGALETHTSDGRSRCYALHPSQPFNLVVPAQQSTSSESLEAPVVHLERTIIGHGQERGGLRSILTNPSKTDIVDFVYFETLPWFMRPFLHTMKTKISHKSGPSVEVPPTSIIKDVFYRPAIDRRRGTQLELILSVPPASTVTLIYEFEKAILRYTEYPPDANRGFNVAPAIVRVLNKNETLPSSPIYLRTTNLLLPLPTPDFSMPYNVIILTSTVIALAFGNIFNIIIRRFVAMEEVPRKNIKALVVGKLAALKSKLGIKSDKVA